MTTPRIHLPYVPENTLDPAAGLNLALDDLDTLVQTEVISMSLTAPPGVPADGEVYIVASPATGAWVGQENNAAKYIAAGAFWKFFTAGAEVVLVLNRDDGNLYKYFLGDSPPGWTLAAGLGDAPSDGQDYVRRDGAWVLASSSGGPAPVVTDANANLGADETNAGNYTRFTHASPTYTFNDATSFVVGAEYHGRYAGAGTLTITAAGTMTINAPAGGTLVIPPSGTFTVKIVAAGVADLFGVTVAA